MIRAAIIYIAASFVLFGAWNLVSYHPTTDLDPNGNAATTANITGNLAPSGVNL